MALRERLLVDESGMPLGTLVHPMYVAVDELPEIDIASLPVPGAPQHGQILIDVTNTAKPLSPTPLQLRSDVKIYALSTNADPIYVGGSGVTAANGWPIAPGTSEVFAVGDLSQYYINGTAGQGVRFIGV